MTLYQFNRLDELEQLEALWHNGVVLAEREDEINRYKLYQIDSFSPARGLAIADPGS